MSNNAIEDNLTKLFKELNFKSQKKYILVILFGLLGDFDSFEYAINLKKYLDINPKNDFEFYAIAIGNERGKEKFCNFTGFPKTNLVVFNDNKIHKKLKISKGIDLGLGGWINMLFMLSGLNSLKTIKEVFRGYIGDSNAKQIFSEWDEISILKQVKFSGKSFKQVFGEGYLRPLELATFRLKNMIEIIQNWEDYILNNDYLPQRGATFILTSNDKKILYSFFSNDVLGYSPNMSDPLGFISEVCINLIYENRVL